MPTDLVPITVRIEEEFYQTIIELAKSEGRSINKQVCLLIRLGYVQYQRVNPPKQRRIGRPKKDNP